MTFSDGFYFWLGKTFAELAMGVGVIVAFGFIALLVVLWQDRRR